MLLQNFFLNDWLVDVAGGSITRKAQTKHLEPKIMKTLAYLASRPNEVVTKDQLVEAVWNRAYVSDAALTRCIFEIRQAFGDNARNPSIVETVPKVGYRLLATPQIHCRQASSGSRSLRWVAVAAIPLIAMMTWSTQITPVGASPTYVVGQASANPLADHAYFKGIEHFESGSYLANANAIALFEKAVAHDPSFGLAYVRLSDSLMQQYIRWGGDRLDEARHAAMKGLELEPLNAQSHNAIGLLQLLENNTESAVESFKRASELDPMHWVSTYNAAITQMKRFDYIDAKESLLRVLELRPEHYRAMSRLGNVYLRIGETDEARYWLERSLQQAPESVMAWTELALLELVTRNSNRAIENCGRVTDMIPNHETCLHVSGMGNLLEGNTAEANRIFDYVIENIDVSDYAQLGKAQILLSKGKTDEGVAAVNAVMNTALQNFRESDDPWRESRIIAACHALLGDKANGVMWLKKSTESGRHFPLWDATDPVFSDLHDDHRFNSFIAMTMDTGSR